MLTDQAEEILRLQFRAGAPLSAVHVFKIGRFVKIVGRPMLGGDDPSARAAYVATLQQLLSDGLVQPVERDTFDLSPAGRELARALVDEMDAETSAPDRCTFLLSGTRVVVAYEGTNLDSPPADEYRIPPPTVRLGQSDYQGHAASFHVELEGVAQTFHVLWFGRELPWEPERDRSVLSAGELTALLKRPGLKALRDHLRGKLDSIDGNVLPFPYPPAGSTPPASLKDYVDSADVPRAEILLDCERDVLNVLLSDRRARRAPGLSALDIALSPLKRRFYSIRDHLRETLSDLAEKKLIQSLDGVRYALNSRKVPDIRRVVAGLPSERLFDAPAAPPQLALRLPHTTAEFDLFFCYASEDLRPAVEPLALALEAAGLKVAWRKLRLAWGESLFRKIQDGLSRSRLLALFLSNAFLARPMSQAELNVALSGRVGDRRPVLSLFLGLSTDEFQARFPAVTLRSHMQIPNYFPDIPMSSEELASLTSDIQRRLASAG